MARELTEARFAINPGSLVSNRSPRADADAYSAAEHDRPTINVSRADGVRRHTDIVVADARYGDERN